MSNRERTPAGPTVCAVVLTLNEETSLRGALQSLNWCTEVYVVDSGSTDNTESVAKSEGARFLTHVPDGRFLISEQRNWAITHIPTAADWFLFLDADEICTADFRESLIETIRKNPLIEGLYAAPAFMFNGKWIRRTSGYPNWHPRVVRAHGGTQFVGGVWEDFEAGAVTARIPAPYIHLTNVKGAAAWLEKHTRYASWEAHRILQARAGKGTGTSRRSTLRGIRYRLGPLRKIAALLHLAVLRGGLLDGPAGWAYLRRMYLYECMIDVCLRDAKRTAANLDL
jgi:glycosyltransferase involved in cell wall biosynthesis